MFGLIESSTHKVLQAGFGMNARTAALVTSSLSPVSFSGLKVWGMIVAKYYVPEFFDKFLYDIGDAKNAPKEALKSKKEEGYEQSLNKLVKYQVANMALNTTSKAIDDILTAELAFPITETLRKEIFEAEEGKISFFLHDVVMHGKKKEAYLLQECISNHTQIIINNMLELAIGLPINALKFYGLCKTVLAASKPIAPYLIAPLNSPNKILLALVTISIGKVTMSYLVERLIITIKESTKESDNKFKTLLDYASKNAASIVSSGASTRLASSMHEAYSSGRSNISHVLYVISDKIAPIFKVLEEDFLPRYIGKGIFADPGFSYKKTFYPVSRAFADIRKVVTKLSKAIQQYTKLSHSIGELNRLMDLVDEAKEKHKEASTHIIVNIEEAFQTILLKIEAGTEIVVNPSTRFKIDSELTLKPGDIMLLEGESGSGKSSLSSAIAFAAFVTKGTISRTSSIYIAPQFRAPMPGYTLLEDIMGKKEVTSEERKEVETLFKSLGMAKVCDNLDSPSNSKLSGGQDKRITLISAIMSKQQLIILDEPFAGLGAKDIPLAIEAIKAHSKERSFVIIDHVVERDLNNFPLRKGKDGINLYNKVCNIEGEVAKSFDELQR